MQAQFRYMPSVFFIRKVFLRKPVNTLIIVCLILVANYVIFISARSIFSTLEGYDEMERFNSAGTYISNLDPNSDLGEQYPSGNAVQQVYNYLDANHRYAFHLDGLATNLSNSEGMEVTASFVNKEYYELLDFDLYEGGDLVFDHSLELDRRIPILVGYGLAEDYPIGSKFVFNDPSSDRSFPVEVRGILSKDAAHSNFYALNSKQYYNFSIFLPVDREFIKQSGLDLKLNALFDLVILDTNTVKLAGLQDKLRENTGLEFNFSSQASNNDFHETYYISSLKFIAFIAAVIFVVLSCLMIWSVLLGIRSTIKEFTLNVMVGLSYSRLRYIVFYYFTLLLALGLFTTYLLAVYSRFSSWASKEASFVTFGTAGLIEMDWLALAVVLMCDWLLSLVITELSLRTIRKVPVSLGVLQ